MTLNEYERDPNRISVAFVTYYYNLLNSHHEKLYQLYYKDAVLKHNDYKNPFAGDTKNTIGVEHIKEYWDHSRLSGAKVMIQSIESTKSFGDAILIVTTGELALQHSEVEENTKDEQPAYKFVQTFVLVPIKGKDVYDVYNDVMTFVPDVDYDYASEDEIEPDAKEKKALDCSSAESNSVKEDDRDSKVPESNDKLEEADKNSETDTGATANEKLPTNDGKRNSIANESSAKNDASKTIQTDKEVVSTSINNASTADSKKEQTKEQNANKNLSTVPTKPTAVPSIPTKDISWASQIAISAAKGKPTSGIRTQHPGPMRQKKELSPVSKRGANKKKDGKKHHHQNPDSDDGFEKVRGADSRKSAIQTTSLNKKGQTVYPIYLKYIDKDSTEEGITKVLETYFGQVDSLRIDKAGAYVNFVHKDSQKRSLAKNAIKINGNEVKIEAKLRKENGATKKRKGRNGKRHGNGSQNGLSGYTDDGFKKI